MALALATIGVYWRVRHFDFVNYDDFYIFFSNQFVRQGLTWAGIQWGATTFYYEYWHPLMWWSHMLDCQLFGLNPGPHHVVSLGLHAANTLLVFAVFRRLTGAIWRSAMVAALFGLHPLHVESVAWLAERKDVLSAFFWLLSVWAYVRYAQLSVRSSVPLAGRSEESPPAEPRKRGTTSGASGSGVWRWPVTTRFYWLSLLFFLLGLLTKPMVVTLPFVLLLLDYWPLGRIYDLRFTIYESKEGPPLARVLVEKIPFFLLTALFCFTTWYSVKLGKHLAPADIVTWPQRLSNVPIAYASYLWKTFWPVNLAAAYIQPAHWSWWLVVVTALLLAAITAVVLIRARKAGYLMFGWFMFLGTLVPTIGIVSVGLAYMADRYMYLPSIGLFVALVWAVAELSSVRRSRTIVLAGAGTTVLAACAVLTWRQVNCWHDSISLWQHCLNVGAVSPVAHSDLGAAYLVKGETDAAIKEFGAALQMNSNSIRANNNYGTVLAGAGRVREATNYFATVLRFKPDDQDAVDNLGYALIDLGNFNGAISQFTEAIRLQPDDENARTGMGMALSGLGRSDDAVDCFLAVLKSNPTYSKAHLQLGLERLKRGEIDQGIASIEMAEKYDPYPVRIPMQLAAAYAGAHKTAQAQAAYRQALRLNPDLLPALNNLAWSLATAPDPSLRNGPEAVRLAQRACELTTNSQTMLVGTLAAACAEAGQFDEAIHDAETACILATAHGETNLLKKNQDLLARYKNHQAYHEGEGSKQ